MPLEIRAATDLGMKRSQNEDSHGSWVPEDPGVRSRRGVLVVVADGMGGSRAGEVASRLAVDTVIQVYRDGRSENPLDDLYHAVESANHVVHTESVAHPEMNGMGTTCTAVVVRGRDAFVAHVGDSRCYALIDGRFRQLTQDHSLVAQLVRDGQLTAEQARSDPRRNVVTRSVGVSSVVEIDAQRFESLLRDGDTLLVCSDGLHGLINDQELSSLATEELLEDGCRRAIAMANQRGGHDNITVVLARQLGEEQVPLVEYAEVDIEPRLRHFERDSSSVGGDADHTRFAMPAMARPEPPARREALDADEDDDPPAPQAGERGRAVVVEPRDGLDTRKTTIWIFIALAVLLAAIAAAAVVLMNLNRQSSALGAAEPRTEDVRWL